MKVKKIMESFYKNVNLITEVNFSKTFRISKPEGGWGLFLNSLDNFGFAVSST